MTDQQMIDRANDLSRQAVGLPFKIQLSERGSPVRVTVSGVIVECGFGYFTRTARTRQVVFKVVMECGVNKTRREFFVKRVPG